MAENDRAIVIAYEGADASDDTSTTERETSAWVKMRLER
jgi:hypothetical protein